MWNKNKFLTQLLYSSSIFFTLLFVFSSRNALAEEVECYEIMLGTEKYFSCPGSLRTCSGGIVGCSSTLCDESSQGVGNTVCLPSTQWGYNCFTQCGSGGGGSVGPPDDDIAWARVFSRSFNSTEVYFGPAEASGLSVNATNRKDWNVRFTSSSNNDGGEIWSGHMCGRGNAASVAADGKLNIVSNSACQRNGQTCVYDNGDGCTQTEWFSGGPDLADLNADKDKISPVNKLHHILKDGFNWRLYDKEEDRWGWETIPEGMPMQRYDQIYTFNFKDQENQDYRVRLATPGSYFCYNAYGLLRHDSGSVRLGDKDSGGGLVVEDSTGERLHIRPEQEDPALGVLDDGTRCDVELAFRGGGNYVLFEVRKAVIGKVVSLDGSATPAGISGIQVSLRYNNNNVTPTTVTTTTDSNGYYRFNEPNLYSSQYYTVYVSGSTPGGHTGSAFAVNTSNYRAATGSNINYTWRSDGRDTRVGDTQYVGQSTITNNDCSSSNVEALLDSARCVFAFNRVGNQHPTGTLSVVNNSNKVSAGLPYDHVACLNGSVSYATSVTASPNNSSLLLPTNPYTLSTSVTGATSGYGTWVNQFQTVRTVPGKSMSSVDSNTYSTARGYKAGSNYYVALTVNDNAARMCSGNPYVNYATYSPAVKYCGAYSPNITNPMIDTNATKPYKTIHISYAPLAPTVVASTNEKGQITVTWSYPSNPGVAYLSDVRRYRIYRGSTHIADVPGSTNPATFRYVDTLAPCTGANVTYTVNAETGYTDISGTLRSCGVVGAKGVGRCPANLPPVCTIQYRKNDDTWIPYNNALVWPKNTTIPVKLDCKDPNGDPIYSYQWTTSCGTISPRNTQTPIYTTANFNGLNCNLTGTGFDKLIPPTSSGSATVVIRTQPATPGTQVLSTAGLGSACLSKTSPTTTGVSFIVSNYDDDEDGIATLNNTLASSICGLNGTSRIGNCSFTANNALSIAYEPLRNGTTSQPIRVTLRTGTTPGSYGINKGSLAMPIRVSWDPYTGATRNINNTICVTDLAPVVTAGTITRGANNSTYTITANARDDWSLKGLTVHLINSLGNPIYPAIYNKPNQFPERTVAQMTNANHIGNFNETITLPAITLVPNGTYRARITITDNSGRAGNFGVFTTAPFVIDRTAPACTPISFIPPSHNGETTVRISNSATDSTSNITKYRVYVKNSSGVQVADSGTLNIVGNNVGIAVSRSYDWIASLSLPRGTYRAYVDWTDALGNVTNTDPTNQCNALYELKYPPVQVGPSKITVVADSAECNDPSVVPTEFEGVNVQLSIMPPQTKKTDDQGMYSFPNANLAYNTDYNIQLTGINDGPFVGYGNCSGTTTIPFHTPTTYTIPGSNIVTVSPIKLYKQEATKWWQAYNGGVHSNAFITFPLNGFGPSEGMPAGGVIIGNPTGLITPPKGFDMYTALGIDETIIPRFEGGGLYSSFGTDPSPIPPAMDFYGNGLKNWGVPDLVSGDNSPMKFETPIETMFANVKALIDLGSPIWETKNAFPAAVNHGRSYLEVDNNDDIGGPLSDSTDARVVFIEVKNGGTVNIDSNITSASTKPLILYVKGNVLIEPDVTEIDSVFLIATGTIEFKSSGDDSDIPIDISGGIYAHNIIFDRDLADSLVTVDVPAERIFYNSSLIGVSDSLPAEITESKVYYILTE